MRIAVDAMGGDYAPWEIMKGAVAALEVYPDLHIIFVGKEKEIDGNLQNAGGRNLIQRISIVPAAEIITMEDHPATAYRRKKDASITVATRLVREKQADAVVSAGSTGGQMVAALFGLGRLSSIDRPAIATVLPTLAGPAVMLDAGANADCKPENLLQFAKMGDVYARKILGIAEPKVGLINIGEEASKGNELTIKAHELLSSHTGLNFIGNIEGRDVLTGKADVMVCDGFVGNVVLKVIEGTASALTTLLKEALTRDARSKAGALLLKPGLKGFKRRLDYSEHGGAPLLGVKGVSIICHGSSKAEAVKNAIRAARECVGSEFVKALEESFQ